MKSLALSLIKHGKIETTSSKAKELRPFVERIITKAKINTVSSRRLIKSKLGADVKKLFEVIGPSYNDRKGGYTRISKLGTRASDGSNMSIIELI